MPKSTTPFEQVQQQIIHCRRCHRLVAHREEIARIKRRAYRDEQYWGRPVPALGRSDAALLVVGLAPGAHGANRTGRMFTGDSSGDFLYDTLHRFGFCNQAESISSDDGLLLHQALITAACRCVPPKNRPSAAELNACRHFLRREVELLKSARVVVALGGIAWNSFFKVLQELGVEVPRPRPKFAHARQLEIDTGQRLIGCYHPSRQNTQTGRLTKEMFDAVFRRARELIAQNAAHPFI